MDERILRSVGIDYDGALARFVGNRGIYEKYLTRFLEDSHGEEAAKAFAQKDYEEMLEQTHALKGVAGTLGMINLHNASADIVNDLREGKYQELETKLQRMRLEQEKICEAIRGQRSDG